MNWFRRGKDEAWRQLSEEIGAEFFAGGFWEGSYVQHHVRSWTITLDFDNGAGTESGPYTRMRAPFVNPDHFRFRIWPRNFLSELVRRLLRNQDIATGDPAFDAAFVVQGNDDSKVRDLFASPEIRRMSLALHNLSLTVIDRRWVARRFPDDVDVLVYQEAGLVEDLARLEALFALFATVLERLCQVGVALRDRPEVNP